MSSENSPQDHSRGDRTEIIEVNGDQCVIDYDALNRVSRMLGPTSKTTIIRYEMADDQAVKHPPDGSSESTTDPDGPPPTDAAMP